MIRFLFYFAVLTILVVFLSFLSKQIIKKYFLENSKLEDEKIIEDYNKEYKKHDRYIKVLPIDAHKIQNLDKKYSPNVYRGIDGKFKSFKK